MTNMQHFITQEMIEFLIKHGFTGFVGTFFDPLDKTFTTIRLVAPGLKDQPFIELETGLRGLITTVFPNAVVEMQESGCIKKGDCC